RAHARQRAELERADLDRGLRRSGPDLGRDLLALRDVARADHDARTAARQHARGLGAEAARPAGDDGGLAAEVEAVGDLRGRRLEAETRRLFLLHGALLRNRTRAPAYPRSGEVHQLRWPATRCPGPPTCSPRSSRWPRSAVSR